MYQDKSVFETVRCTWIPHGVRTEQFDARGYRDTRSIHMKHVITDESVSVSIHFNNERMSLHFLFCLALRKFLCNNVNVQGIN